MQDMADEKAPDRVLKICDTSSVPTKTGRPPRKTGRVPKYIIDRKARREAFSKKKRRIFEYVGNIAKTTGTQAFLVLVPENGRRYVVHTPMFEELAVDATKADGTISRLVGRYKVTAMPDMALSVPDNDREAGSPLIFDEPSGK